MNADDLPAPRFRSPSGRMLGSRRMTPRIRILVPPIVPLRPPEAAPNVLIVLFDDAGFGSSSAFGGPCAAPTSERLAGVG